MSDSKGYVSYLVFESALAREERHNKRLVTIIIVLIVCWLATIAGCFWYISLPVEEYTEISQTADDIDNQSSVSQSVED